MSVYRDPGVSADTPSARRGAAGELTPRSPRLVRRGTALADCRAAGPGVRINGGALPEGLFPPALESSCQSHPNQLPIHHSRGRERNGLTSPVDQQLLARGRGDGLQTAVIQVLTCGYAAGRRTSPRIHQTAGCPGQAWIGVAVDHEPSEARSVNSEHSAGRLVAPSLPVLVSADPR